MGKIAAHEFISLDGVFDTPTWTFEYGFDPKMGEAIGRLTSSSGAILLGRQTYEEFYPAWSTRSSEEDPGAPFFNDTAKYVPTTTLTKADWNNTTLIGPYSAETIGELKSSVDGDIYVSGSGTLVRALLSDGLLDELHLFVYPVTLGRGKRLFTDGGPSFKLALTDSETYDNGVVHLAYRPAA